MEKSTAKKSVLNIISSIFSQFLAIALGLIIPRLYLVSFGSEINGLLNSIGQVFTYLALLEAGVGTATLQALYKPIAENDSPRISSIMAATDRFYKRTGAIYFFAVIALSLVYPLVIKSDISSWTIFAVILLNGLPGAIGYFFQGKFNIFLNAEGKAYVLTNLNTAINFCVNIMRIVLIMRGYNIVTIQMGYFVFHIISILFVMLYIKKHYNWIDLNVKPDYNAISQKNSVLIMQLCDMIFRHTDVIVLTMFCNLKVVSVYAIYNSLLSMVSTFLDAFSQGFSFALGQKFNTDRKRYIQLHDVYETYRMTLVFSLFSIAYIFIIPFLRLYTAGVEDINYIDPLLPTLFIATFLLSNGRANSAAVINYAQHFKQMRDRCVIEAVINLSVSLVCVNAFGIYGVLMGTIAALLYRANDMIIYANKVILKRSPWVTYKRWFTSFCSFTIVSLITSFIHIDLSSYLKVIIWASCSCVLIIPFFFVVISLVEPMQAKFAYEFLRPHILNLYIKKSERKN